MKTSGLTDWVDILTVVLYFVFVLSVGFWSIWKRSRGNVQSYFLAGRSMTWVAVGASLFGSNIGSEHFVGLAGAGAASGMVLVLFEWIPGLLIQVLSWFFLPVFISAGVYTLPEYMEKRFGSKRLRIYLSVLALFLHIATKLAVTIFSGALYIQLALGWNMYSAIIGLLLVTAIFTVLGGLAAVMYTDTAQSVIMVIGAFIVLGLGLDKIGGYENLPSAYMSAIANRTGNETGNGTETCGLPRSDAFSVLRDTSTGDFPWPAMLLQAGVACAWYWICDQVMVQRCLAAKNMSHAKAGTLLGGYLKILPLFIMVIPGMISRVLFPDEVACVDPEACIAACDNPAGCSNIAYPKLVLEILPKGARGLIMAVMLSAIVTSLTSIFNSSSTVFTMDLWRQFRPGAKQRELLMVGRIYILILCLFAILWIPIVKAAQGGQLFSYMVVIEGFVAAPLAILFFFAVFWKRATEKAAFFGLCITHVLGGILLVLNIVYPTPGCLEEDTRPLFLSEVHSFYYSEMLMALQAGSILVISLCTKPRTADQLSGVTWWTKLSPDNVSDKTGMDTDEMEMHVHLNKGAMENDPESDKAHSADGEVEKDEEARTAQKGSSILLRCMRHIFGTSKGDASSIAIPIASRLAFLREPSKLVRTVNNTLAIILIAAVAFLIGVYH